MDACEAARGGKGVPFNLLFAPVQGAAPMFPPAPGGKPVPGKPNPDDDEDDDEDED